MTEIISTELPNEPTFDQLLRVSRQINHIIIHDPKHEVDADYAQLLTDLLRMRGSLYEVLPKSLFDEHDILREENPYILILAPGGYEFIVAAFAILSIGGALVPLATGILAEEALQLLTRCNSAILLAGRDHLQHAMEVQEYAATRGLCVTVLQIQINASPVIDPHTPSLKIGLETKIAPHRPGLLLFTSGTSGPPKGVVHTRNFFKNAQPNSFPSDVVLSNRPPHWMTGLASLIKHPLRGARLEITCQDPAVIWERLRAGGVTILRGTPRFWTLMMRYYQDHISCLPFEELNTYIQGAQALRVASVGASTPHSSLLRFWREILGQTLKVSYGSTELGGLGTCTTNETDINLERCIGRPVHEVAIRLSHGDHGEILFKSPYLFSHYLGDEVATRAAFTSDGLYKSGDLARRIGHDYIFDGRASGDFVNCRGYKVQILLVEQCLKDLPFISDGCILPVPDENNSARVAALVRFEPSAKPPNLARDGSLVPHLQFLREELATTLPAYMLPTALRVLQGREEIPLTTSNKVIREKATEQYFPLSTTFELPADVEVWDPETCRDSWTPRPWDWAGIQAKVYRRPNYS